MARLPAKKAAPKKLGKLAIASLNKGFYGEEVIYDRLLTSKELSEALTWYNYNMDDKTGISELVSYLQTEGRADDAKIVKAAGEKYFTSSLGRLARIVNMGGSLPQYAIDNFEDAFSECKERYIQEKQVVKVVYKDGPKLKESNVQLLEPIEEAIDRFAPRFNLSKYLTKEVVSSTIAVKIAEHYEKEQDKAKKLPVTEFTTQFVTYLDKIISEAYNYAKVDRPVKVKVVKVRKPRRKKVIPPEKKVAKVKIAAEFPDLNLKSVPAKELIGAKAVWVYDTRYSKLTVLRAKEGGLDVKGSTVLNFDEEASESKRIGRKAAQITKDVVETGKVGLRHIFSKIKASNIKFTGRLSANNVLLRVEK